jgi:hypothetical protein
MFEAFDLITIPELPEIILNIVIDQFINMLLFHTVHIQNRAVTELKMVHGFRVFPTADDDLNVVREGPGEPIG